MTVSDGHVFVVHGRIESVVHDYAIVPTDDRFSLREYWRPVVGKAPTDHIRPEGWPGDGFGRSRDGSSVWFLSVGDERSVGAEALSDRAVAALREMQSTAGHVSENRVRPLVAMPVLGISGGGLGERRGDVVRRQLETMQAAARELDVDIAVVTPDASVHAAAQYLRRQSSSWPLDATAYELARNLGQQAKEGQLALFLGAGVSIPAGLPTWGQLLERLGHGYETATHEKFKELSPLDQAQLTAQRSTSLGQDVASIVGEHVRPALSHALLASLGCREVVTTNYDRLYEAAVDSQHEVSDLATILPWQVPEAARPWILKLHGDYTKPESIVLTRDHFVGYERETKPAGALLQSLLMTRHLLFVGASLNDDNVVRLLYEVDRFRRAHELAGTVGTLLDVDRDDVRRELWEQQLDWVSLPGGEIQDRARQLEVFLDAVAAHASRDSSWLLDERFSGLLPDEQRELADRSRGLHRDLAAAGGAWQPLVEDLSSYGAAGSHSGWGSTPPKRARTARVRVADVWDDVLQQWISGRRDLDPPLDEWMRSYQGTGAGAVDLDHYPDPYIGDLRGLRSEPRLVFLGLNPGVGYDELQGDNGIWTRRIAEVGYSRCFERSPEDDRENWVQLHGKRSRYWINIIRFTRLWLGDDGAGMPDILNLELYPWHSAKITGSMKPPARLLQEFVWDPIEEVPVGEVFAFGRYWLDVCRDLELEEVVYFGPGADPVPGSDMHHWRLGLFRLPSGQLVVTSSQEGFAGPPNEERTAIMREVLERYR